MQNMMKMRDELNEHRYALARNVERETEHLLKRIALLESCNAALSGRLAEAQREITLMKRQSALVPQKKDAQTADGVAKLHVMGKQVQKAIGSATSDKWGKHATAV